MGALSTGFCIGGATLTQVDTWHESSHPQHWTKNFHFEAELPIGVGVDSSLTSLHTRTELRTDAAHALDFVGATTFLNATVQTPRFEYHFQPRGMTATGYALWVRTRNRATGVLAVSVDGRRIGHSTSGVSDDDATSAGAFCWSRVGNPPLLVATPTEHVLGLEVLSGVVHVDALRLVRMDDQEEEEKGEEEEEQGEPNEGQTADRWGTPALRERCV